MHVYIYIYIYIYILTGSRIEQENIMLNFHTVSPQFWPQNF